VATKQVAELTEAALIQLMVGREISQLYPAPECTPGEVACSLRGLGCSLSGVHDVTLDLRKGEVVGLAGLVGAGRTELARVLFGITPADAGQIILDGREVSIKSPQDAIAHGIAYVPEDRRRQGVIQEFPIAHNVTLAIHGRIFPRSWLRLRAERQLTDGMIRDLGIKTRSADNPVSSLSGGNQQKVSIARWLATQPKLLILDEPTQGVDVAAKAEIHRIVRALAKQGLAVLLISSDLPEVLGMSDRIAVIRGGTVKAVLPRTSNEHEVMAAAFGQKGTPE
jgi:rhamnose transport system ATP-binding protein